LNAGGSILVKFLAVLIPVFVITTVLGLQFASEFRLRSARNQLALRVGSQLAQVAGLVSEIDFRSQPDITSRFVRFLTADRAIACAELRDGGLPDLRTAAPNNIRCKPFEAAPALSVPLPGSEDVELVVRFSEEELNDVRREGRKSAWSVTAGAVLAALFAGALGFRHAIGKPLERLLTAIRRTAVTKQFVQIDVESDDEIGTVIRAFNELQRSLQMENERTAKSNNELAEREKQLAIQNTQFSAALENMAHGLTMFDAEQPGYLQQQLRTNVRSQQRSGSTRHHAALDSGNAFANRRRVEEILGKFNGYAFKRFGTGTGDCRG
jgi:hypothetical protein